MIMMELRKITYDECKILYDKLVEAGYPAQMFKDSSMNWKVSVEDIITNGLNSDIAFK